MIERGERRNAVVVQRRRGVNTAVTDKKRSAEYERPHDRCGDSELFHNCY
jgi:hypothetical protein